jgi:hypothetical protein
VTWNASTVPGHVTRPATTGRGFTHAWIALALVAFAAAAAAAEWHHPLYLDGGGTWRARIAVTVTNDGPRPVAGEPVGLRVGTGGEKGTGSVAPTAPVPRTSAAATVPVPFSPEADLVGAQAQSVRVCNAAGVEMLFGLTAADGTAIDSGPIPAGATLVIPAECPARGKAVYYVYFDNPAAGLVPDFLSARLGAANGDVEQGDGPAPAGWHHDQPDAQHRASWTTENHQSGKRCLKTVVAEGAEPTWISTRQSGIRIRGGAKYVMKAWVKGEGVKGYAGWYIHVGTREAPMILSPMLYGGEGTFGWKEVTAEFTAPAEADTADLGTVLRGTGTAWFDNVRLACLEPGSLRATAAKPQRIELREIGLSAAWDRVGGAEVGAREGDSPIFATRESGQSPARRAVVRVVNFADQEAVKTMISVDASMLDARLGGRLDRASLCVFHAGKPVPHFLFGTRLLFEGIAAPRSAGTYYVYFARGDEGDSPIFAARKLGQSPGADYAAFAASGRNLVKNPGFEEGGETAAGWTVTPSDGKPGGVRLGPDPSGGPGLGKRCVKMVVPHNAPKSWRGWQQGVPVLRGHTYLYAAWVRCEDLRGGEVRLHAHCHDAAGRLCKDNPMRGTGEGIRGTAGWTLLSGTFTMPDDAATFRLHLTMDATGTVWHDGVVLAEIVPGRVIALENRPADKPHEVQVWPVNAVVKVFQDEPAPRTPAPARITLARNEQEPLQLAVRSGRARQGVRVEVDPPIGPGGAKLDRIEVAVVGYVPIDHPTSYYSSTTPEWHRKFPAASGACDGWAGLWPDPLLPRNTLDLAAGTTQAVWITISSPKSAPAGDYRGKVRLADQGGTLAVVPFDVRVWDFTLPDESHVKAIYDARLGPGGSQWGKPFDEVYPELVRFMARRRLCPDAVHPAPKFAWADGRATADFAEFDKAAAWYFDELKLPHSYTPWSLYVFGWGFPPKATFGQQPYPGEYPFKESDRAVLRPEYKRAYQACLKLYWDHVKQKGWHKRITLYISDEPFYGEKPIRQQMKALCEMIHEVDPAIPVYSSTWHHVPDWDGALDVWGIGHYGSVPVEQLARIRAAGRRIWFTTDGQMCTDTPYCAVERLLPHYCFKYGADAYEFWGVAWTTYDPYRFGWHAYIHQSDQPGKSYWVRYPNGDGFLIYPGAPIGHAGPVSSIRLEQAREGVEDYEYLYLLRESMERARSAGKDTTAARQAMDRAAGLIAIPNAGGRYSTKILPDPEAVPDVKRRVAEAIEGLGN